MCQKIFFINIIQVRDWKDNWRNSWDLFSSCLLFAIKTLTVKHSIDFQFVELNGNIAQCNLFRVNIFEKPDTGGSLFTTPPFHLSHLFPMVGQ